MIIVANGRDNKKRKVTQKECKDGYVLNLAGDCVELEYNPKTKKTSLTFDENCDNPDAVEMFSNIGIALAEDNEKNIDIYFKKKRNQKTK